MPTLTLGETSERIFLGRCLYAFGRSMSWLAYTRFLKFEEISNRITEIASMEENVMGTDNVSFGRAFLGVLAVLLMTFSVSCSFEGLSNAPEFCAKFDELPLTTVILPSPTADLKIRGRSK